MSEMATLDAFFNKVDRRVCSTISKEQNFETLPENEKNVKEASRKRGRSADSHLQTKRLQRKRQKPLDSNLNVSDICVLGDDLPEVVGNCRNCSQTKVGDTDEVSIPSSTIEISYEEFLSNKGIAHVEVSCSSSEDTDADVASVTDVKMSPVKTSLRHILSTSEPLVNSLKKSENSPDEDECEENALSNSPEVASKDIRCFFGKADKAAPLPLSAAILMKVKADIHCSQSQKRNVSSKCVEGHTKIGSDLARMQRAAIMITDDDLDIEVIGLDDEHNNDFQIDFDLEDDDVGTADLPCSEVLLGTNGSKKLEACRNAVGVETASVAQRVGNAGKLASEVVKLEAANDEADAQSLDEAVQNVDYDVLHCQEEKCSGQSDDVIMVEKTDVNSDSSSTAKPNATGIPDVHCTETLATKSRKPNQVKCSSNYDLRN